MTQPLGSVRSLAHLRSQHLSQQLSQHLLDSTSKSGYLLPSQVSSPEFALPRRIQHCRSFAKSLTLTDAPTLPDIKSLKSNSHSSSNSEFSKSSRQSVNYGSVDRNSTKSDSQPVIVVTVKESIPVIVVPSQEEPQPQSTSDNAHTATVPIFRFEDEQGNEDHNPQNDGNVKHTENSHQSGRAGSLNFAGPTVEVRPDTDSDYFTYLLSRKFSSSNFIQKMDSRDVVWGPERKEAKMVGPYMLGEVIGRGSFGKVKEGICSETLQRIAIKIVQHKRLRKIANGVENVTREIKLLQRLKHRNCIRLLEVFCKAEGPQGDLDILPWSTSLEAMGYRTIKRYLVFEYCSNNLQAMLDSALDNKLPLSQCQRYFNQLIEGLIYLHSHNIIHRDIKPSNLLVTFDGVLKISDYGVAESLTPYDGKDSCTSFAGTHQFLAPEVASGAPEVSGNKVDVWAAGVTLYNMCSGRYPFELVEGNIAELYEKIQHADFAMPLEIEGSLADLIRGMLEKDSVKRLSTQQIQKHSWCQLLITPTFPDIPIIHPKNTNPILPYSLFKYLETMFGEELSIYKKKTPELLPNCEERDPSNDKVVENNFSNANEADGDKYKRLFRFFKI